MLKYILLFAFFFQFVLVAKPNYRITSNKEYSYFKKNKIKKCNIFISDSLFSKDLATLYKTTEYDKNGKPLVDSIFDIGSDKPTVHEYKYNQNGDLYVSIFKNDDLYPVTSEYVISEDGKNEGGGCDGGQPSRFVYEYNDKGLMISFVTFIYYPPVDDSTQGIFAEYYKEEYKYDKNDNLIETQYFKSFIDNNQLKWEPENKIVRKYKSNNLTNEVLYLNDGTINSNTTYYYDKSGKIKMAVTDSSYDMPVFKHYFYEYY